MAVKTPLTWYGGKQRLAPTIVGFLPQREAFVEPFAGGLAVLFERQPVAREVVNDLDGSVCAFWRAVRERPQDLAAAVALTPYSREEWEACANNEQGPDDVETARRLLVSVGQSFGGNRQAWVMPTLVGPSRSSGWRANVWGNLPDRVAGAAERLRGIVVENTDAVALIKRSDRSTVTIYADPPYANATRLRPDAGYHFDDDGTLWPRLVEVLCGMEHAAVVLSGYPGPDTEPLEEAGWARVDLDHRRTGTVPDAPEALWLCPRTQAERSSDLFAGDPSPVVPNEGRSNAR